MPKSPRAVVAILMGVSGVGKTSVGKTVARRLGWEFFDADDFHAAANVSKMRRGIPLDDADREGWLEILTDLIATMLGSEQSGILACSALKKAYRDRLQCGHDGAHVIYLRAGHSAVADRLQDRTGHYFDAALLDSQYADLEEPEDAVTVDAGQPLPDVVADVERHLRRLAEG